MGARRHPNGPLRHSDLVRVNNVVFWEQTLPPAVAPLDTDEPYTIEMQDRIDLLAYRKLGVSQAGWVIMERNDMRIWPDDFVPGREIKIPTRDSLRLRGIIS